MIEINVESYCQNCPDFEAVVEKTRFEGYDSFMENVYTTTIISCKHRNKCAQIRTYLEKEIKE